MVVGLPDDEHMRPVDRACVAVLIADPHPATRSSLRIALNDATTLTVVGDAPDLSSAISRLSGAQVDIVLADSRVAGLGGESARGGLAQLSRRVPVIVMGMGDPRVYTAPLKAAGATGYWPKDGDLAQLTELLSAAPPRHLRAATSTPRAKPSRSAPPIRTERRRPLEGSG